MIVLFEKAVTLWLIMNEDYVVGGWIDDGDKCADADFIVQMNNDNNSLMNIKSLKNKIENTNVWGEVNVMMEQVEDKINDGEEILDIDFYCYGK